MQALYCPLLDANLSPIRALSPNAEPVRLTVSRTASFVRSGDVPEAAVTLDAPVPLLNMNQVAEPAWVASAECMTRLVELTHVEPNPRSVMHGVSLAANVTWPSTQ